MKNSHLLLGLALFSVGVVSCTKQDTSPDNPKLSSRESEVVLTSDEVIRLQLMSSNANRSMSDVIKSASSCLPELFTKSTTMTISDSMVYGGLTRSGDSDPLVLYVVSNDNGGYAIVSQDQLLPSIIAYSEDGRYVRDSMALLLSF